jgi:hypothetical protein
VEKHDVAIEVLLALACYPLLEVSEIELRLGRCFSAALEPSRVVLEVEFKFVLVENAIHHVAAKQPQFNLVAQVAVQIPILMHLLEHVGSHRTVAQLE